MLSSVQLKQITAEARPIIERMLDDADVLAGMREVVAANGGDWSALKALIKAQIKDERDEAGDGKHVRKIIDKAGYALGYADMLGVGNLNEKNSFADEPDHDPLAGEITDHPQPRIEADLPASTGSEPEPILAQAGEVASGAADADTAPVRGGLSVTKSTAAGIDRRDNSTEGEPAPEAFDPEAATTPPARTAAPVDTHLVLDREATASSPAPVIPFKHPDDGRPRSREGFPRPVGCQHVDACAKTWRDTEPCSLCRKAIAVEPGGTSIDHHGFVA